MSGGRREQDGVDLAQSADVLRRLQASQMHGRVIFHLRAGAITRIELQTSLVPPASGQVEIVALKTP